MVILQSVLSISGRSLFLMMLMMMNLVFAAGTTGFTLNLIHRDSPKSPLYRGNLTKLERFERGFQQSKHREQKRLSTRHRMKQQVSSMNNTSTTNNTKSDIDMVRPEVKYDDYTYMVELGIGTFASTGGSPSYYNFYFDTGSDLLWLQCDPTRTGSTGTKQFLQNAKIFNLGEGSLTYNPLPYDSPNHICMKYVREGVPPEGLNFCGYRMEYADGASTEGVLATEKLTVRSDSGGTEEIKDFVFGCAYRQNEPDFGTNPEGQNPIAGMLGLGGGEESFISQLGDRVDKKFEYCLKPWYSDHVSHTLLRFGSDTKIVVGGPNVQTTNTFSVRGETLYYVNMVGISIEDEPVVYPEGSNVFGTKPDGTGGCIFDSGSDSTSLSKEVYVPFEEQLIDYLYKKHNITRSTPTGEYEDYDLCFENRSKKLPNITFHFKGADFVMEPKAVYIGDTEIFCLVILQSEENDIESVTLGSKQQANHRILHDAGRRTISWVQENCDLE